MINMKNIALIIIIFIFSGLMFQNYNSFVLAFDNTDAKINNYKKEATISFDEYLHAKKSKKDRNTLKLNNNGDVIFKNKIILTSKGVPLNETTAYTTNELKVLFAAKGVKPKKWCNPKNIAKNGLFGCYIDNSKEKYLNPRYIKEKIEVYSVDSDEIFTQEKINTAIDFSKKIKYIYKIQDMELLAQILPYPVTINKYKNRNITINTKEEFKKLNKNIILNKDIYNAINNNKLFWNWQGFMLGNGQIWFWVDNDVSNVVFNFN